MISSFAMFPPHNSGPIDEQCETPVDASDRWLSESLYRTAKPAELGDGASHSRFGGTAFHSAFSEARFDRRGEMMFGYKH